MVSNSISTKQSTTSHLNTRKTMAYGNGNPGSDLGQAQQCGRVKQVNEIPILPLLIIEISNQCQ